MAKLTILPEYMLYTLLLPFSDSIWKATWFNRKDANSGSRFLGLGTRGREEGRGGEMGTLVLNPPHSSRSSQISYSSLWSTHRHLNGLLPTLVYPLPLQSKLGQICLRLSFDHAREVKSLSRAKQQCERNSSSWLTTRAEQSALQDLPDYYLRNKFLFSILKREENALSLFLI